MTLSGFLVRALGMAGGAFLACQGAIADQVISQGPGRATVSMRVPMSLDTTQAMAARDRFVTPPIGVNVVRNRFFANFPGRTGPQFQAAPDPVDVAFGGTAFFPGPSENGWTPGDPNLAVGPNHVVAAINGRVQILTKAGASQLNVTPETFFSGLAGVTGPFDPRCWYDPYANRFWVTYGASNASGSISYILVALSDDDNPNGTWAKWALNVTLNGTVDSMKWMDYPGLGGNQDIIMISGNMFPISGSGTYAKVRVLPKAQFLAGAGTLTYTDFWSSGALSGEFSLQPARHLGTSTMPFLAAVRSSNQLSVFGVNNPLGTPTLTKRTVSVTSFGAPASANQKGTTDTLDTLDTRIYDVSCRNNNLLVTHNISGGGGSRARWYHVNTATMPASASLVQSGNIESATEDIYFAALHMNQLGNIGTAVTKSSANEYVSVYYTGRESTDTLGTMKPLTLAKAGTVGYTGEGGTTNRWGDYQGGGLDPGDDFTFWAIAMLPSNASTWKTEIFSFTIGSLAATLTGNITLDQYVGSKAGLTATLDFRTPSTTTVIHSYPITLDASGNYNAGTVAAGTWDVAVKFNHWLRSKTSGTVIATGANTVNLTLINGDASPNNIVDIFDLNSILSVFGSPDPLADLDGSGTTDIFDMNTVLGVFGTAGAP